MKDANLYFQILFEVSLTVHGSCVGVGQFGIRKVFVADDECWSGLRSHLSHGEGENRDEEEESSERVEESIRHFCLRSVYVAGLLFRLDILFVLSGLNLMFPEDLHSSIGPIRRGEAYIQLFPGSPGVMVFLRGDRRYCHF